MSMRKQCIVGDSAGTVEANCQFLLCYVAFSLCHLYSTHALSRRMALTMYNDDDASLLVVVVVVLCASEGDTAVK